MHTYLTRDDLMKQPRMARNVDGPDALPTGAQRTFVPYTGAHRDISLVSLDTDRAMYLMRQGDDTPEWMRLVKENARAREAERRGMYDWDCHHCQTSVMTHDLSDACPNCYL